MGKKVFKTGSSQVVRSCQICANEKIEPIMFLGYLPPVNKMNKIGEMPKEETSYPALLLYCPNCHLVQLGLIVDANILFPPEYPYTSSTTRILRENFAELYSECSQIIPLSKEDLVVDIGSNDGNLLSNFKDNHRILGITPEDIGKIAIEKGIPTILEYFNKPTVDRVVAEYGKSKIITATNVFAHIEHVNDVLKNIMALLNDDGVFISESHYLLPLIESLQYDTIYHEHLRYYSLHSLKYLFEKYGMEIFHAKRIPTHGGSIRVYASRKGNYDIDNTIEDLLNNEKHIVTEKKSLMSFKEKVVIAKLQLMTLLLNLKMQNKRIFGISAPSRASTLINYTGLDDGILDCVVEIKGSYKIGKYIPGTLIPIKEENRLYTEQPDYALVLSWHISDELIEKLKAKGFNGKFIVPLPEPHIVE
jgi:hypothetical protein